MEHLIQPIPGPQCCRMQSSWHCSAGEKNGLHCRAHTSSFTRSIFHTQLCHTHTTTYIHTYVHTYIHTYLPFYLLDLSPPPLSFLPSLSPLKPLKLIIGRSWLVGLSGPLIFLWGRWGFNHQMVGDPVFRQNHMFNFAVFFFQTFDVNLTLVNADG